MATGQLAVVIIAGNEEKYISDCLRSCNWADEIVMVAANSTDATVDIAKKLVPKIKIYHTTDEYNKNFTKWRNIGFEHATRDWIFYLDADERITPSLKKEILATINSSSPAPYYVIPRANFFLDRRVRHGGTYPDYVKRLFQRHLFHGFTGILHEEPVVDGQPGYLKSDLLHYTRHDLSSMLRKTLVWTEGEAQALFDSGHPPIVWWRIIRMMLTKIWQRLFIQQMWRDGTVGWISAIFETFDTFIIYARLWEIQQQHARRHL